MQHMLTEIVWRNLLRVLLETIFINYSYACELPKVHMKETLASSEAILYGNQSADFPVKSLHVGFYMVTIPYYKSES